MKKSVLMGALMASTLCLLPVQAETPNNETATGDRSEVLALMLAAYVSCDEADTVPRDVRVEVKEFGSDFQETVDALTLVTAEQMACNDLRDYAQSLVTLASTDPDSFEALFGLNETAAEDTPLELAEGVDRNRTSVNTASALSFNTLRQPPSSGNLTKTSDYKP